MTTTTIEAEPFDYECDPATTALIMIDFQRDFVIPNGFGEALGNDVSLLRATDRAGKEGAGGGARSIGMLVVHTREGHRRISPTARRPS